MSKLRLVIGLDSRLHGGVLQSFTLRFTVEEQYFHCTVSVSLNHRSQEGCKVSIMLRSKPYILGQPAVSQPKTSQLSQKAGTGQSQYVGVW